MTELKIISLELSVDDINKIIAMANMIISQDEGAKNTNVIESVCSFKAEFMGKVKEISAE